MTNPFENATVIHAYTRAEALADGTLVDITKDANEAGFRFPTAMTAAAWADAVEWNDDNTAVQDQSGRLWDVLTMARHAARSNGQSDRIEFQVLRVPNDPHSVEPDLTDLVLHIGPGDDAAPVLTIMLPGED